MSYIFEEEEIKVIKEFPNYGISNLGYVYRDLRYGLLPENYRKKRLKGYRDKKGYIKVHLSDGKNIKYSLSTGLLLNTLSQILKGTDM